MKRLVCIRTRATKESFDVMQWKCDLCQHETDIRADDTPAKVRARRTEHLKKRHPIEFRQGTFRKRRSTAWKLRSSKRAKSTLGNDRLRAAIKG